MGAFGMDARLLAGMDAGLLVGEQIAFRGGVAGGSWGGSGGTENQVLLESQTPEPSLSA